MRSFRLVRVPIKTGDLGKINGLSGAVVDSNAVTAPSIELIYCVMSAGRTSRGAAILEARTLPQELRCRSRTSTTGCGTW
jgi:hypothetical protein